MRSKLDIITEVIAKRANEGGGCYAAAEAGRVPCFPVTDSCECYQDAVAILTALNREATR